MEFNEKLQALRKQRGLTQEQLAAALYVSRTAISKWESGRGYPGIDTLKALAAYFSVTIDELLSGGELLSLAEQDGRSREERLRARLPGMLDLSAAAFFFLPLFARRTGDTAAAVALPALDTVSPGLRAAYYAVLLAILLSGVTALLLRGGSCSLWERWGSRLSLALNAAGVLLFIAGAQPYAASLLFLLLLIRLLILLKKQ